MGLFHLGGRESQTVSREAGPVHLRGRSKGRRDPRLRPGCVESWGVAGEALHKD